MSADRATNRLPQTLFMDIARVSTYLIVMALAFMSKAWKVSALPFILIFLVVMIYLDYVKNRVVQEKKHSLLLNLLSLTVIFAFGLWARYDLYMILYFVCLVDYYMALETEWLAQIVALIYVYDLIILLVSKLPPVALIIDLLSLTSLIIFSFVLATMAIQQRREREKVESLQVRIVQQAKMASLGQLTAGIAHEINSPLGAIHSNAETIELLLTMLNELVTTNLQESEREKAEKLIEKLRRSNNTNEVACERIIEIVRKMKNFARVDEAVWQEVDFNEGVESALVLTSNEKNKRIKVYRNFGQVPKVRCIPSLINQVSMNILTNAVQAIETEGEIHVSTYTDGGYVYLIVHDTGIGISEENLPRIFDPGFTTKGVGVGMGLGLAICYNIMQQHNGEITCKSEAGLGTTFIVKLPIGTENKGGMTDVSAAV